MMQERNWIPYPPITTYLNTFAGEKPYSIASEFEGAILNPNFAFQPEPESQNST